MPGNTNSITECLSQIIDLTKKNLAILKGINDSFYTKKEHLAVMVNDEVYTIPSFISLESRIESLEHNLENILDAPLTGEAFTYFDGTTQRMELSGYHTAPNHIDLQNITNFNTEPNNIFKDFMSPNPFVKVDMASIPNNIKHAMVRKITILEGGIANNLHTALEGLVSDGSIDFADVERVLYAYMEGLDYTLYDTVKRLPIRNGVAQGEYDIVNIIDDYQDSNFDEFYELELDRDLVYYVNNGTIQRDLHIGDKLVTYNDKVMMEIVDLNAINRTIKIKVLLGAYADLQDITSNNPNLYKLKFYSVASDVDSTKYLNVPLEEDQYILIFVAPINDTTNTRAPWGRGIFLNTNNLTITIDGEDYSFRDYYNDYVNNVGDALLGITSMMDDDQQVSRLNSQEFSGICSIQPTFDTSVLEVTQINKHLDDTKSIKAIRNLYEQKTQNKVQLDNVQRQIDSIRNMLNSLAFDDSSNTRTVYETQLTQLEEQKSTIIDTINKTIQEISSNANDSETPIENAKYRIRGFIDIPITDQELMDAGLPAFVHVIKMDVEYRYKNKSNFTGNAKTFGDDFIFSDWNKMDSIYRNRIPYYENGRFIYDFEAYNGDKNEPSFNQVDIPITQGESVDIRVRYIYNLGYPFVETRSDWSLIYTQDFPVELTKNVEILDIIAENNDEIKTKAFENILSQKGVLNHIDDAIQDQNIKYFHKAEHISSGFLTDERRVIPLDSKLQDFNTDIQSLKSEVFGVASTNLIVTLTDSHNTIQLKPDIVNRFHTYGFKNAIENSQYVRYYNDNKPVDLALSQLNINFFNNGDYDLRLYSLFPGSNNTALLPGASTIFSMNDYTATYTSPANSDPGVSDIQTDESVYMMLDSYEVLGAGSTQLLTVPQVYNQFLYFRRRLTDEPVENMYLYRPFDDDPTATRYDIPDITSIVVDDDPVSSTGVPTRRLLGSKLNVLESLTNGEISSLISTISAYTPPTNSSDIDKRFACLYPYPGQLSNICIPAGDTFITLGPGESISVPINFIYWFATDTSTSAADLRGRSVTRMMAFDIRTSLYRDPITYKFTVDSSYEDTKSFELRKNISNGIQVNKLQRLIPTTPRSVARNSTGLLEATRDISINTSRKNNR